MKKILISTDFSVPAENAARYGVKLAKAIDADVLLCNAIKVPAEAPMAAQVAWPLMDYATLQQEVTGDLDELVKKLCDPSAKEDEQNECPLIAYESNKGTVYEVVSYLVKERKIDLVVMGMAGASGVIQFLLGSNSKEMIEKADFPVLFVPYSASFRKVQKIVFATNLAQEELGPLQLLIELATPLNAEITIAHITDKEVAENSKQQHKIDAFLNDVIGKINHPKIKYEKMWNIDIDNGLDWIVEQKDVDLVAIVHQHHNIFGRIFKGSHTQKLSRHIEVPLLVFPSVNHSVKA